MCNDNTYQITAISTLQFICTSSTCRAVEQPGTRTDIRQCLLLARFQKFVSVTSKYLSYCVSTVSAASGRYRLRFTGSAAYILPRTRTKFGERGFLYSSGAAWNTLPSDLHDITDTSTFRKRLKNVLFDRAYNWLLLAFLDESYSGALQISCWLIDWLICRKAIQLSKLRQ